MRGASHDAARDASHDAARDASHDAERDASHDAARDATSQHDASDYAKSGRPYPSLISRAPLGAHSPPALARSAGLLPNASDLVGQARTQITLHCIQLRVDALMILYDHSSPRLEQVQGEPRPMGLVEVSSSTESDAYKRHTGAHSIQLYRVSKIRRNNNVIVLRIVIGEIRSGVV